MKVQRCQRTPFQVMLHDCELATWADVRVQFRLVVNVYEPHLPSLDDGEPAGRCCSQRPAVGSQDAPERGGVAEVPFVGERHKLVLSTSIRGGYPVVARSCSWCPQRRNLEVRPRVVPGFRGAITCRRRPNNDPLSTVEN
jgi:hypothetical protein